MVPSSSNVCQSISFLDAIFLATPFYVFPSVLIMFIHFLTYHPKAFLPKQKYILILLSHFCFIRSKFATYEPFISCHVSPWLLTAKVEGYNRNFTRQIYVTHHHFHQIRLSKKSLMIIIPVLNLLFYIINKNYA